MSDDLKARLAAVPKPPWPAGWRCTSPGCGHRRDEHREPIGPDGTCAHAGCQCYGWDPLTTDQWKTVYEAQRVGIR